MLVWGDATAELRSRLELAGSLLLLPGGQRLAAISLSEAAVWDTESGQRLLALESDASLLERLAYGRFEGGPHLVASSCGQVVAACNFWVVEAHDYGDDFASVYVHLLAAWDVRGGRLLYRTQQRIFLRPHLTGCGIAVAGLTTMADEFLGGPPVATLPPLDASSAM